MEGERAWCACVELRAGVSGIIGRYVQVYGGEINVHSGKLNGKADEPRSASAV